ncbi:hypothetical protein VU04_05465 [Desulfobulbus sp. TB]|nr:hypothetical protein [Desulfobulbus sp. TB]
MEYRRNCKGTRGKGFYIIPQPAHTTHPPVVRNTDPAPNSAMRRSQPVVLLHVDRAEE